jgi:DNA-binding beta-propeller fold protein YncE
VNVPFDISLGGLAYDPARDIIYATGAFNSPEQSALFVIDVKNHSTTLVGLQTQDAFLAFGGLALDPSTGLLYATGFDLTKPVGDPGLTSLYVVDPATGTATKVGPTGVSDVGLGKLTFVPAGKSDK